MEFHEKLYQLRKETNMSQEQLAEKLHVSRQAVGKWESGAALPDISNIIELSKIFNVSLNELLQVEYVEDKSVGIDEVLIKRLEKNTKKQQKRNNVLFIGLGILCLVLMSMVNKQNDKIDQLENQLIYQYDSLVSQINTIYFQPSNNNTSQLFEMSDVILGEPNYEDEVVSATVRVTLKEFKDTTKIQLRINDDGTEYIVDTTSSGGGIFEAVVDLNMKSDHVAIYGIIDNDGLKQTEEVYSFNSLKNKFYSELWFRDLTSYYTNSFRSDYTIHCSLVVVNETVSEKHYFVDLEIQYVRDGVVLLSKKIDCKNFNEEHIIDISMDDFVDALENPIEVQAIYHDNLGNEYIHKISRYYKEGITPSTLEYGWEEMYS